MTLRRIAPWSLGIAMLLAGAAGGDGDAPRAAPPAVLDAGDGGAGVSQEAKFLGTVEYSHGDPSDEEQLILELMNYARMDPAGEAARSFVDYDNGFVRDSVDHFLRQRPGVEFTREENRAAFLGYAPQPPFALNAQMSQASANWSQVQKEMDKQAHNFNGFPNPRMRLENEGYFGGAEGQSIYAFARDMVHGHAALSVDWGQALDDNTGRPDLSHRRTLMNFDDEDERDFREVGIGIVKRPNPPRTGVGPNILTIDFAVPLDEQLRYVTGVCFVDLNGNGMYDIGEGVEGVRIDVSSSISYAITSSSGGYAVPIHKDDGPIEVDTSAQPGTAAAIIGNQTLMASTFDVDPNGGNVKADFMPPPPTAFSEVSGPSAATVDGGRAVLPLNVGQLDPDSATLGDLDVKLDIDHPDRSELTVTLVSPSGTQVVLWDHGPPGNGLTGTFDTTIRPLGDLRALIGEVYEGGWELRVDDDAGGGSGNVDSWSLCVRPQWVQPLFASQTNLFVTKLKLKDSPNAGKDSILVKGELDVGALLPAGADQDMHLVFRSLDAGRPELFHVNLGPAAKNATLDGVTATTKVVLNKKTSSRTQIVAKVKGATLPQIPAQVEVQLALGDTLAGKDVPLARGAYSGKKTPPLHPLFRVDKLKSNELGASRIIVVKGRLQTGGSGLGQFVTVGVGGFLERRPVSAFARAGDKYTLKNQGGLKKFVIDLAKGTYLLKVVTTQPALVDGAVPVSIGSGDFYGETRVVPRNTGSKLVY